MRRYAKIAVCFLAAFAAASAARSAPDGQPVPIDPTRRALPVEGVITNADWLTKPNGNDMARFYPQLATAMDIEANVIIHCTVTAGGNLAACAVVSETPKGLRFGEATLQLANLFRMKPMTLDGMPVSGGAISIPVHYALPKAPPPAATAPTGAAPPSPKAVALAHRIAVVTFDNFAANWQTTVDNWKKFLGSLTPEEQTLLDAYGQSMTRHASEYSDQLAAVYAATYSEAELAGIAAFYESPAGHAWVSRQASAGAAIQAVNLNLRQTLSKAAFETLCQQTACPKAPTPAAR